MVDIVDILDVVDVLTVLDVEVVSASIERRTISFQRATNVETLIAVVPVRVSPVSLVPLILLVSLVYVNDTCPSESFVRVVLTVSVFRLDEQYLECTEWSYVTSIATQSKYSERMWSTKQHKAAQSGTKRIRGTHVRTSVGINVGADVSCTTSRSLCRRTVALSDRRIAGWIIDKLLTDF